MLPEDRSQHLGEELQGWAQTAGRRGGRENFYVRLKLCRGFASSGFFWASSPDTARSPSQADPGLSPLWRLGEPMFPVHLYEHGGSRSHSPGSWALSLQVGSLEEGVCPLDLLMTCESSKTWQEFVSWDWDFSLKTWSGGFSGALPAVKAHLPLRSSPVSPVAGLLFSVLCFSSQVLGSRGFESQERCTGAVFNESNRQVLLEILFSFGATYISWGKSFYLWCIAFQCMQISTEMDEMMGREDSALRSEDKTCLWIRMEFSGCIYF